MKLSYLFAHAKPYTARLALVAGATLTHSLSLLAIPWLAAQLVGDVLGLAEINLAFIVALLIGAILASTGLTIFSSLLAQTTSARILADFRKSIYSHVQALPMNFHDQGRQGDLLALMTSEASRLSGFVSNTLATTPALIMTSFGAIIALFWIDSALALLIPVLVPGFYLILRLVGRKLRFLARELQQAEATIMGQAEENLEMLPAIKSFAREEIEFKQYGLLVNTSRDLSIKQARISAFLGPLTSLLAALGAVAVVLVANARIQSGDLGATELFGFLFYTALLTRPIGSLAMLYGQVQIARGMLARLQRVIETPAEPGYTSPRTLSSSQGAFAFHNVSFTYPGRDTTLNAVNVSIKAGETVALTGSNGAGKSTFVNLLLRFYEPESGTILVDGEDISGIQVQSLRRRIGYVPQRPLLFNGTIRDNIAFGDEAADDAAITKATSLAQARDFIDALPEGQDTVIGDHGVRLSGGQRQRIALSRALVADPPILILDEATSMYDLEGEAAFIEACQTALRDRTVILITHRPASLALASRVFEMEAGVLSELRKSEQTV